VYTRGDRRRNRSERLSRRPVATTIAPCKRPIRKKHQPEGNFHPQIEQNKVVSDRILKYNYLLMQTDVLFE